MSAVLGYLRRVVQELRTSGTYTNAAEYSLSATEFATLFSQDS